MNHVTKRLAPPRPRACLSLGVTGHRAAHGAFSAHAATIEATLSRVLDIIALELSEGRGRLNSMLADGADQLVAAQALARGWELTAPLPFGADLNCALNAHSSTPADARALLGGGTPDDAATAARAEALRDFYGRAHLFELADSDAEIAAAFIATLEAPSDQRAREALNANVSARVALASRVVVEQSDILIAIWDGVQTSFVGGTGHTIATALRMGAGVVWIDAARPESWCILRAQESLSHPHQAQAGTNNADQLRQLVHDALHPPVAVERANRRGDHPDVSALDAEHWRSASNPIWHAYRRIEAVFGNEGLRGVFRSLTQTYESPEAIAAGSGAELLRATRELPGADATFVDKIAALVLPRFAWADGISSHLSDTYRGGMMINFALSSLAIVGGMAYLPLADWRAKWAFALFEFVLLSAILVITWLGQKKRWHGRWFETRRVAEYLRHAPILLALGAARAPGRWPRGSETSWPEWYARHALREVGLPRLVITPNYLRACVERLLDRHIVEQRNYHRAKAARLTKVHHNLDRLSEFLFQMAVASVVVYLAFQIWAWISPNNDYWLKEVSTIFTFLGVLLPTFGGAIAGIRYFGDFERFAAISEVTARKLDALHARITLLLSAGARLDYAAAADLAHAADDIVVAEIESWQAVFGGKQITVPV